MSNNTFNISNPAHATQLNETQLMSTPTTPGDAHKTPIKHSDQKKSHHRRFIHLIQRSEARVQAMRLHATKRGTPSRSNHAQKMHTNAKNSMSTPTGLNKDLKQARRFIHLIQRSEARTIAMKRKAERLADKFKLDKATPDRASHGASPGRSNPAQASLVLPKEAQKMRNNAKNSMSTPAGLNKDLKHQVSRRFLHLIQRSEARTQAMHRHLQPLSLTRQCADPQSFLETHITKRSTARKMARAAR